MHTLYTVRRKSCSLAWSCPRTILETSGSACSSCSFSGSFLRASCIRTLSLFREPALPVSGGVIPCGIPGRPEGPGPSRLR